MFFDAQSFVLGGVQGATEFLPISSSGHLALLQIFWGWRPEGLLAFDLLLHCATMLSVFLFFRKDIGSFLKQWGAGLIWKEARKQEGWRYGWSVVAATVATALVALPLKNAVEAAMASRLAVGGGLLVTGTLLCFAPRIARREEPLSLKIAVLLGVVQGLAVFPGVSRSGSTILAGLWLGLSAPEAFRFSFLMSVPAIAGATLLEGGAALRGPLPALPDGWALAVAAAFVAGCLCLAVLRRLVLSGKWACFGVYCLVLGLAATIGDVVARF